MNSSQVSPWQEQSLEAYERLMGSQPDLFRPRHHRPLVTDRPTLEAYAAEHDVVLGVVAENRYVIFVVDLVEGQGNGGERWLYPYMRIISQAQLAGGTNVVVFGVIEDATLGDVGSVVLVDQERHALGRREVELPRGFGIPQVSGDAAALHELRTESGYVGNHAHFLGSTTIDSGMMDATVSFYHIPINGHVGATPEREEAVSEVLLLSRSDMWSHIASGRIRDSFTVQALAFYERRELKACTECDAKR
jgi:ADP-ribose pyrophosphatase